MEQSVVTLIVGLAGITSTLAVSGMGLYYTAKSRAAPFRQSLFSKQIEIVMEVANIQSRIRALSTILAEQDSPHLDEARLDIGEYFTRFAEAEEKAAVLLPVDLWVEVKRLSNEMADAIIEFDSQGIITQERMKTMIARMTKVALLSRTVLGCDELTEQSINLFSIQAKYRKVTDLEISHLEDIHSRINRKGGHSDT